MRLTVQQRGSISTPNLPLKEPKRRQIVNFIYIIFALSLVEGALRKWVAPQLATPLYFLRDPFVLWLYVRALQYGFLSQSLLSKGWFLFAGATSIIGGLAYIGLKFGIVAWLMGIRSYFLYMPLAFIIAHTFHLEDVNRFLRLCLIIAIPYALLVIVQYSSPADAWINSSISADDVATVSDGIVRPYGLFTYTGQNVNFVAFLFTCFAAMMSIKRNSRRERVLFIIASVAVAALCVLTGSRAIYFLLAAVVLATVAGGVIAGQLGESVSRLLGILTVAGCAAGLLLYQFSDMYDAMNQRVEVASAYEGSIRLCG